LKANAILSGPTLDYKAISGANPANLVVAFDDSTSKERSDKVILQLVDDYMVFAGVGEKFVVYNLVLPKMGMATDLANSVGRIEGIELARAELVDEHIDLTKGLENYAAKRRRLVQRAN
jgi:hypothetical protein